MRVRRAPALATTPLTSATTHYLSTRIREADAKECWAMSGRSPEDSLTEALNGPGPAYTAWGIVNGLPEPVGAFGIAFDAAYPSTQPAIWSLWTDDLDGPMRRCIMRQTREWVLRLLTEAGVSTACNFVMDSNKLAVRWLRSCGCFVLAGETDKVGESRTTMRYFQTKPIKVLKNV